MVGPLQNKRGMKLLASFLASLLAVGFTASVARADGPEAPVTPRSENTALALSIGGTLAGPALMVAGVVALDNSGAIDGDAGGRLVVPGTLVFTGAAMTVLGPSFGHWYAGRALTPGMALRAGGLALAAAGAVGAIGNCEIDDGNCGADPGRLAVYAGIATFVGGAVYDIATAPRRVRERNQRVLAIVPTVSATGGGVSIAGAF
jgi:hypothetical protein